MLYRRQHWIQDVHFGEPRVLHTFYKPMLDVIPWNIKGREEPTNLFCDGVNEANVDVLLLSDAWIKKVDVNGNIQVTFNKR